MSISSKNRAPSVPSTVSLNNPASSRASKRPLPPLAKVVTIPPWARDEPPSPTDQEASLPERPPTAPLPQASDAASFSTTADDHSRWWSFTLPTRTRDQYVDLYSQDGHRSERKGFRDRSISWLQASASLRDNVGAARKDKEKERDLENPMPPLPLPSHVPPDFSAAQPSTPGWDLPWSGRLAAQGPHPHYSNSQDPYDSDSEERVVTTPTKETGWTAVGKRLRSFILSNTYVPLLFRVINMAFTAAALAMAIHIRQIELNSNTMGAIGSSPIVVIIFAPLTLLHVMSAIYLDYFGRPLGLWRTSAKLAHTLSETLFICLWSAALSLCFDNFFTSLIPCASHETTSWYNELPRPEFNNVALDGLPGKQICDSQLALICLVGVGLIAYCTNLIISLYRIFEKVKFHTAAARTS